MPDVPDETTERELVPFWNRAPITQAEWIKMQRENASLKAAAILAENALIETNPTPKALRIDLDRGICERMINKLGAEVYDPNGRLRAILAIRAALKGQP